MTSPSQPVDSSSSAPAVTNTDATSQDNTPTGEPTSFTTISSLSDLREKAPKIYNAMLQGIAMNICQHMKHMEDQRKQIMKYYERHS